MKYINKLNRAALKIKVKHLAAEARIIRQEEAKWRGQDKLFFKRHRKTTVRHEARATQLVIAMLRGVPYRVVEPNAQDNYTRNVIVARRMVSMIKKYASPEFLSSVPKPRVDISLDFQQRNRKSSAEYDNNIISLIWEWFRED